MFLLPTDFPEIIKISPEQNLDLRGSLSETYRLDLFSKVQIGQPVYEFISTSKHEVLRGIHFQFPPQGKLVQVVCGKVFDVVVDLRKSSPNFGKYMSMELSDTNQYQLWIPVGFGHGFYVLSENARMLYKMMEYHHPEQEFTLLWNDKDLNISWPLIGGRNPIMSSKDQNGKLLKDLQVFD